MTKKTYIKPMATAYAFSAEQPIMTGSKTGVIPVGGKDDSEWFSKRNDDIDFDDDDEPVATGSGSIWE